MATTNPSPLVVKILTIYFGIGFLLGLVRVAAVLSRLTLVPLLPVGGYGFTTVLVSLIVSFGLLQKKWWGWWLYMVSFIFNFFGAFISSPPLHNTTFFAIFAVSQGVSLIVFILLLLYRDFYDYDFPLHVFGLSKK